MLAGGDPAPLAPADGVHTGGWSGGTHGMGTFGSAGTPGVAGGAGSGGGLTDGGRTPPAPPTPGTVGAAGAGSCAGAFGAGRLGRSGADGGLGRAVGSLRRRETLRPAFDSGSEKRVRSSVVRPGWLGPRYEPHFAMSAGLRLTVAVSA